MANMLNDFENHNGRIGSETMKQSKAEHGGRFEDLFRVVDSRAASRYALLPVCFSPR